jgi:ring-1,2-phenylacetyl-CoA epoxidase subunit PaaC
LLLTERPNDNWGNTIIRSFFFDVFHYYFLSELTKSKDEQLAAIAAKSLKEVTYHVKHNSDWVIRLGDGTEKSHKIMQDAVDELWDYTGEMFDMDEVDEILIKENIAPDLAPIKEKWLQKVKDVFREATLEMPEVQEWHHSGGKMKGIHSEHMGYILSEMQYLPRVHPDATW